MHTVKLRDLRWCPFVIAVSARYRFVVLKRGLKHAELFVRLMQGVRLIWSPVNTGFTRDFEMR